MRYCFAVDLVNDEKLIAEYEQYHEKIWPEIRIRRKLSDVGNSKIWLIKNQNQISNKIKFTNESNE
jgi:L-rhamnose mutarotase